MAHETESPNTEDDHGRIDEWELIRIGGTALFAAAVWFHVWEPFHRVSVVGLLGVVIGGWPIFHEAWENIRERRMTMELSMTIALLSAVLIGEFFTALMIATFVLVAEVLEGLTVGRGRRAIRDLLDLPAGNGDGSAIRQGNSHPSRTGEGRRRRARGAGRTDPGRWNGAGWRLLRRSGDDHRRVDAGSKDTRIAGVCRHDQSVRRA